MDAKLFFDPVSEDIIDESRGIYSFHQNIHVNSDKVPDLKGMHVALIGLTEDRGGTADFSSAADAIRKKLYSLKRGTGEYKIVDLGNLRNGVTLDETYLRIREVCEYLISHSILPILFGGSHDLDFGQYISFENMEKLISFINVDAFLDINENEQETGKHIEKILLHDPNFLFNYSHLAYQSYLIHEKAMNGLEKLYFDAYRVGLIKSNMSDMEPIIREGDVLSFDIGAIRSSDAPGTVRPQPFGLTGEEACQIAWYAGINEKMSSVGFYEYFPENDDAAQKTAAVVSTMIWYFIEGFYHRSGDLNFKDNDYLKYVVAMPSTPESIVFYKSKLNEKWWMEVPLPESNVRYTRNFIVPCSYEDYRKAADGDVPDRYISTHARLI